VFTSVAGVRPTGGELRRHDGTGPRSIAIVHCVGSLSAEHLPYCSGICCEYALKFNHIIEKKLPGTRILRLYRELVLPGKEEFALYGHARHNSHASFARYGAMAPVRVRRNEGDAVVEYHDEEGRPRDFTADMVVLCPAVTGSEGAGPLARVLETPRDAFGFFEELHGRLDSAQSKVKGIYMAGACQAPMDIQKAMNQGMACAGYVLSGLVEGRTLEVDPITAWVDDERCSRCRTCASLCPYKAIGFPEDRESASVNALLCHGCGTCVAACPAGAMHGNHFENDQILAEIGAVLV
jgi:heterodisulfide reductase subunit A